MWDTVLASLLPALAVALVSFCFNRVNQRKLEELKSRLSTQCGFSLRKIEAHEKLWPLVAECNRAQATLSFHKGKHEDLSADAQRISQCRKDLKNFVYDSGLYFGDDTRKIVQDLDTMLGNPAVEDVRQHIQKLENHLRERIEEIL